MNRAASLFACGALCACAGDPDIHAADKAAYPRGLIVLGIDGMDPKLTRELLAAGKMPNLAAVLARGGSFGELDTTMPPQSPVAWSTIVTGEDTGGHGIYDFVHRDAEDLTPYLSTSRTEPPDHVIEIGSYAFPLDSAKVELLREGRAFWQDLEAAGVPATVVKMPANFPPAPSKVAESSSGMGTPDLLGTYGTFQVFTDDPALAGPLKSGIVHRLEWAGQRAHSTMSGPPNPIRAAIEPMNLPVEIVRDAKRDVALVQVGDRDVILTPGEWSEWIPIAFDPGLLGGDMRGMVRLYLRQLRPTFHLYASPMNIDPLSPAMPVSSPPDYAAALAHDVGRSYTQGMPEDTKAVVSGVLSDPEFLTLVSHVMDETWAALDRELARFHGGLLFVYLSSIDQTSHMFFRSLDPEAPPGERVYADAIPALYRQVDGWLGKVIARAPHGTEVLVMSDHGFTHYRTKVHLNSFLAQHGYLAVLPESQRKPGTLGHIDWAHTQAYALGLNEVFVNLAGREGHGIVSPADKEAVLERLEHDLRALRDPDTDETAITRVDRPPVGHFAARAPDLIVGYRGGYRSSDESALGAVDEVVFEPNRDHWSGDHCMDPAFVPGVIAFTRSLAAGSTRPTLIDIAPSILQFFGIHPPRQVHGRPLLERAE